MTIKFLTLNVWHGGKLGETMLDFLEQQNPDILVLQEAYNETDPKLPKNLHTVQNVRTRLKYSFSEFAGSFRQIFPNESYTAVQGNAVLSRFPLTAQPTIFFDRPFDEHYLDEPPNFPHISRCLQHVEAETPNGKLNVFNFQGVWDLDGDNYSPQRQKMSDVLVQAVSGKPNVILAGDTNAKPTNPAMRRLDDHLVNVFGTELTTSFNMRRKTNPGYATAVVDMIFVSPDIQVITKTCPNVDVSDHLPLVVELEIGQTLSLTD